MSSHVKQTSFFSITKDTRTVKQIFSLSDGNNDRVERARRICELNDVQL
jgi:hypothetical protein